MGTKTITAYPVTTEVETTATPITTTVTTIETDATTTFTVAPRCSAPSFLPVELDIGVGIELRQRSYPPSYSAPKPKCFMNYKKNDDIKSACKCLNIKPSTKTVKTTKTVKATVCSTKTINKSTVTVTPTITNTKTITAPASTSASTTTVTTKIVSSTVTEGDIAIPTGAFNIVLTSSDGTSLTAIEGLRGTVIVTNVNSNPVNFLAPVAGSELPLGTSFTLVDGGLNAEGQTGPAYLSDSLGNDPQQVSFDNALDVSTRTPMTCSIQVNDDRCVLACSGTPATPGPVDGGEGLDLPDSPLRKRGILIMDPADPVPEVLATPYVCGLDNSFNLGGGGAGSDETAESTDDAACTRFVPVVVDVEPLLPTLEF